MCGLVGERVTSWREDGLRRGVVREIVLPESYDERMLFAAEKVTEQGLAKIVIVQRTVKARPAALVLSCDRVMEVDNRWNSPNAAAENACDTASRVRNGN